MVLVASGDSKGPGDELSSEDTRAPKNEGLITAYTLRDNDVLFGRGRFLSY